MFMSYFRDQIFGITVLRSRCRQTPVALRRFDPKGRKVEEWQTPGGPSSLPYALTSDHRGRLWFVETGPQPNRLVGYDPKTRRFFSNTGIPSGGSTVRHMVFDPRKKELWFGTDKNTIGRAKVT